MVERLTPRLGRLDEDAHLFLHLALADIFLQRPWPQTRLYDRFVFLRIAGNNPALIIFFHLLLLNGHPAA